MKISLILILLTAAISQAADWTQWRGPNSNGSTTCENIPEKFDIASGENIAWVADLPNSGVGNATPIIFDNKIFVSCTLGQDKDIVAMCINAQNGKIVWKKVVGKGRKQLRDNNMAAPSPVCDSKHVWFTYGNGTVACFKHDGTVIWERNLEADYNVFSTNFGYSCSPLLYDNKLYIPVMRDKKIRKDRPHNEKPMTSFVLCIDALSGENEWYTERVTGASGEPMDSYASPILRSSGDQQQIIIYGANVINAYDPQTGKELWNIPYTDGKKKLIDRLCTTPVMATDDLLLAVLTRGNGFLALQWEKGAQTPTIKDWTAPKQLPDVCSPVMSGEYCYILDGRKRCITKCNAQTGAQEWQQKMETEAKFYSSPIIADGKVFCQSLGGDIFILDAVSGKIISTEKLNEKNCGASMAVANQAAYIRTPSRLIKIATPE